MLTLTTFIVQKSKNLDFVVKSVSSLFMCSDFLNMSLAEVGILLKMFSWITPNLFTYQCIIVYKLLFQTFSTFIKPFSRIKSVNVT